MTKQKTVTVLGPDNVYLSHCTSKRALALVHSGKAIKVNAVTIRLKNTGKEIRQKKHDIIHNSKRICYICNKKISENEIATIDHVIPKSRHERANAYSNMKCCCVRCNNDKNNMTLSEYVSHIYSNREQYEYINDTRLVYLKSFAKLYEEEFYSQIHILKKDSCNKKYKNKRRCKK